MLYQNGRKAKNGDKVVRIVSSGLLYGILYDLTEDRCKITQVGLVEAYVDPSELLHYDCVFHALPDGVPDSSKA